MLKLYNNIYSITCVILSYTTCNINSIQHICIVLLQQNINNNDEHKKNNNKHNEGFLGKIGIA